jgi:tripartite motif-containing protein 71
VFDTRWGSEGSGNGEFKKIHTIAIDSNDVLYAADSNNGRIQKFDSDGRFIREWKSQGDDEAESNHPHGRTFDSSDNLYVTDAWKGSILKYDDDGKLITRWGSHVTGQI